MDPLIQVTTGDSVELNCQVLLGNPKPAVNWLYEGQPVKNDEYTRRSGDGNIYIDDVQVQYCSDLTFLSYQKPG